jgi:hypothetical protein
MKDVLNFMGEHPWFSFFALYIVVVVPAKAAVIAFKLLARHLNIRAAGWPPPHVDADGNAAEPEDPKDGTRSQD